jgi:hypothetical protein
MRISIAAALLVWMFGSAQADEILPLFGSEGSGVVEIAQPVLQQQASLAEVCEDKTCPMPRKAVIQTAAQNAQP